MSPSSPDSFPGGLSEESDDSPVATALREAKEELGIPPSKVDVWGKLPRLPDRVSIPPLIPVAPEHVAELVTRKVNDHKCSINVHHYLFLHILGSLSLQ